MTNRHDILERWLAAEAQDAPDAEERLDALFRTLPAAAPPAGFARRVLVRAGVARAPSAVERWRWAVAAMLVTSALTLAGLVAVAWRLAWTVGLWAEPPTPVALLFDAVSAVVRGLAATLSFLIDAVPRWLRIATAAAETPEVLGACGLAALAAAGAFHLLQKTIERERSWSHVPTTS